MGATGTAVKAGYSDCATWATAFAAAGTIVPLVSETLSKAYDLSRSEALIGVAAEREPDLGTDLITGDIVWELDYDNHGLLAYCFGALGSGIYDFAADITDWFHFQIDKSLKRYNFAACAVNSFGISGEIGSGKPVHVSASVVARSLALSDSAFPSISDTAPNRVYAEDLLAGASGVLLGDQTDALSASTDNLAIKTFEFRAENNLQTDGKDTGGGGHVLQPLRQGFRKVTLRLGLARYATPGATYVAPTSLATWKDAGTRLQASMLLTGTGGTMLLQIPEARIPEGLNWNVGGPGVIEDSVLLECYQNLHNTPMSAVSDQARLTTT